MARSTRTPARANWHETLSKNNVPALGFLEVSSLSRGLFLTDTLLKKAPIELICSQSISSGKHALLYFGDVASVQEAHQEALRACEPFLVQEVLIPNVHPALVPFLGSLWSPPLEKESFSSNVAAEDSLCILESKTLAGAILASDRGLKMADVRLVRLQLGQGIGGKAYFIFAGELSEVQAASEAAKLSLEALQSFAASDTIARPSEESLRYF